MTVLQSIFPETRRRIEASDFRGVGRLSIDGAPGEGITDDETLRLWNRLVILHPARLLSLAEDNFGQELNLSIGLNGQYADIEFKPAYNESFSGGITFGDGSVRDTRMTVHENFQGRGLGNAWLKTCIELLHAIGYERLPLSAGLENGAYSWGRAGAYLQRDPAAAFDRTFTSHEIIATLDAVSFAVPKADYYKARTFATLTNRDDLARLCDMETVVSPDLQGKMPLIAANLEKFLAVNTLNPDPVGLVIHRSHETLKHVFERAAAQEKPVTLPRLLLTRRTLDVIFDFNDEKQMEKAGQRLGGWEHLIPA